MKKGVMKKVKMKKKNSLKQLRKKLVDLEEQLKRALADYRNLESRLEKEKERFRYNQAANLIDKLLPILDDLERADREIKNQGLQMAINQFKKVLASEGVTEIDCQGKEFDPETMDCLAVVKGKENQVKETVIKGYRLNGKVIRPAKVKVGQGEQFKS